MATTNEGTPDTNTRQLAINAAFLKDIKDDNRDLKLVLDKIHELILHDQTAVNHWPELISLFADLRDQLALHFALEEAYGYFDDAIVSSPQLSICAENLRQQHSLMFERICELADKALEVSADSPEQVSRFLKAYARFRHTFEEHEEAELKLILDSLDDGIGVGD